MRSNFTIFAFFAVVFFLTRSVTAQWVQTNGPYGATVSAFAVSGRSLIAGTYEGFYLSTNNGASWTEDTTGMGPQLCYALVVSGANIFAGTEGGVFLSSNNGISWSAAGLGNWPVLSLVAIGTYLFAGTYDDGVFLSNDNGARWTAVDNGLPDPNFSAVTLEVSGMNLFAETSSTSLSLGNEKSSVFLSTNNGTSWAEADSGNWNPFSCLATSGTDLFAGTNDNGVFLSTDTGTSWAAVNSGLPYDSHSEQYPAVRSFALSGTNLFAGTDSGIYFSTNKG